MLDKLNQIAVVAAACALAGSCTWESIHRVSGSDCTPTTCDLQGKDCDQIPDGCGGTIDCGTCGAGSTCGAAAFANLCCGPTTCFDQATNCGVMPTNCGGTENCGDCSKGFVCGGDGRANVCGLATCTPTTCTNLGADCGLVSNGCDDVVDCGTCPGGQTCGGSGFAHVCGESTEPNTARVANCFNWPVSDFSTTNFAAPRIGVASGAVAPDFTLQTPDGASHQLSALLLTKPVLLQLGSFTSSVFQESLAAMRDLVTDYEDRVHMVIVHTVEAHPLGPDASPYSGNILESSWSGFNQPKTYDLRLSPARGLNVGTQLILVDDLTPGDLNNPVWCTYGPAQNAAFLIAQDGTVVAAHRWFGVDSMALSIQELLAQ